MAKKYKFKIGEWVVVSNISVMVHEDDARKLSTTPKVHVVGQICGAVTRFTGIVERPSYSNYYDDGTPYDYEPPYLDVKGSVMLWEVREGLLNTPILALEENITSLGELDITLPGKKDVMSAKERVQLSDIMRSEMEGWPRDEKGRWRKYTVEEIRGM